MLPRHAVDCECRILQISVMSSRCRLWTAAWCCDFGLWLRRTSNICVVLTAHPRHLATLPALGMVITLLIFIVAVAGVGVDAGVPADSHGNGQHRATLVLSVATTVSQGSLQHMGMCRMLESALQNRIDIEVGVVAMTLGWWSCVRMGGVRAGCPPKLESGVTSGRFLYASPPEFIANARRGALGDFE
jgi:hypothetical protein